MKTAKNLILTALFSLLTASAALAVDGGNTKPRINSAFLRANNNSSIDLLSTVGAGNIKGVSCYFLKGSSGTLTFTVDGATPQTVSLSGGDFPYDVSGTTSFSGWIPMNIRFGSSIRIQMQHTGTGDFSCLVSWAVD